MTTNIAYALARAELIRALTAYSGITTADGAVTNDTLVDANLIGMNDFLTEKTILIGSGLAQNEDKGASSFNPVTGEITVYSPFSSQILAGTVYRVLNISSVELDVALMNAKIGTNVDAPGTTTIFAWLSKLFAAMGSGEGLVYYGVVTAAAAPSFTIPTLAGHGAGKFADATAPYQAFVLRDAGGGGLAPQGEMQPLTGYVTATGVFTAGAFTAAVDVGDEILIIHPRLAVISGILTLLTTVFALVNAMLVTTETGGTVATTGPGTEDDVYINNAPAGVFEPLSVLIDFTNQTAAETVIVRTYYRIRPAGAPVLYDEVTFAGVQHPLLKSIELQPNRYGIQVTIERTAGAARNYDWEAVYRV